MAPVSLLNARLSGRGFLQIAWMLVPGYRSSDVGPVSDESAKFLGGLINDAFQLFGAPAMSEAAEN
jgi:hypothetical protein